MKKLFLLFFMLIFYTQLQAKESDLDKLLNIYAKESDLSKKTKLENSGHRIIFTRRDLERMQARSLKDVLKSYPLMPYKESRYGFSDILYTGGSLPFSSGSVRVFIDEQELSNALYGSGFEYLGDIDLNFIDHIEIYGLTPTFEYSTEPTTLLIKLYSKVAQRDMGGKFQQQQGSMGYNAQSLYYTDELKDFSYFVYASRLMDVRKKYKNSAALLSRDQERYHLFAKIYNEKQAFQFEAIKNKKDMFIGMSNYATPNDSLNDYAIFHLGYDNSVMSNLKFSVSADRGRSEQTYSDLNELFAMQKKPVDYLNITMNTTVLTSQLKYHKHFEQNNLVVGAKYRYKNFEFPQADIRFKASPSNIAMPTPEYSLQQIASLFVENGYNFAQNSLLTFGAKYSHVENDASIASQDLSFARLGYTYTTKNWAFNTTFYTQELPIEPYMYNPLFNIDNVDEIKPQVIQGGMVDIKFTQEHHTLKFFSYANSIKDYIGQNSTGKIINFDRDIFNFGSYLDYTYFLNRDTKFTINMNYSYLDNLPKSKNTREKSYYGVYARVLSTYNDTDFFGELLYNRDTTLKENFYDLSLGIKYQFSINLALSVKGENILDKANVSSYYRLNPATEMQDTQSLRISPIDQRFIATMDYLF